MKKLILFTIIASLTTCVTSCTWVKLDSSAENVRVAYSGNVDGCRKLGTVSVSVKHDMVGIERNDIKVRDELETLARNEAVTMKANTIVPLSDPKQGEQRFEAYVCP